MHKRNNSHEVYVHGYYADGFCPETETIFEMNGCYVHGHENCPLLCHITDELERKKLAENYERTKEKKQYLLAQGYSFRDIWECEFRQMIAHDHNLSDFVLSRRPCFYKNHKHSVTMQCILQGVRSGELFGMVEVDIHVPQEWNGNMNNQPDLSPPDYFQEFSPLFCNAFVPFNSIGTHLQQYIETNNLSKKPRKVLVGGMRAHCAYY